MLLRDALVESNPWWKDPLEFFDVSIRPRHVFAEIEPFLAKKQMVGVYGLRRIGKSFLLYYVIKKFLAKTDAKSILYFSFDDFGAVDLTEVLKTSEALTGVQPQFIFLDEVQKLDRWAEQVKRVYDLRRPKIFVSGSESLFLKKTSRESLGGRLFEFPMKPLSFREYLEFKAIPRDDLHSEGIRKVLDHYLLTGGFPELVGEADPFFIRKYIKEGIIDKAIFREIPERFKVEDPSLLERILNMIIDNPGMLADKTSLAQELGVFRTTVSKYLLYLETSFLVKSLYNYSHNATTSEKKMKKYYPGLVPLGVGPKTDPAYFGKVVETACVLWSGAKFFWRSPQKDEVDIVLTDPLEPVEVKYRDQPNPEGVFKFQHKFGAKKGLVITKNAERKEKTVSYVPFEKWLLKQS